MMSALCPEDSVKSSSSRISGFALAPQRQHADLRAGFQSRMRETRGRDGSERQARTQPTIATMIATGLQYRDQYGRLAELPSQ